MQKAIKYLALGAGIIVLLGACVVAYILFGIDPNSFKPQLTRAASAQGVDLDIRGPLSWSFFPTLALEVGETRFESAQYNLPPSTVGTTELVLDWGALLQKQISVHALVVSDADLHFRSVEQAAAAMASPAAVEEQTSDPSGSGFSVAVDRVEIKNSKLTLIDADGTTVISDINLKSTDLDSTGALFPVRLSFDYLPEGADKPVSTSAEGTLAVALKEQMVTIEGLQIKAENLVEAPLELTLSGAVDLKTHTINLDSLTATLDDLALTAEITVEHYHEETPVITGKFDIATDNLRKVINTVVDTPIATANKDVLQKLKLSSYFAATPQSVSLDSLKLALDNSRFEGNANVNLKAPRKLLLNLKGDNLNLDDYMAPETEQPSADEQATVGGEQALFAPLIAALAVLEGGDGDIKLSLDNLQVGNTHISSPQLALRASGRQLNLRKLDLGVYGGTVSATATINLVDDQPMITFSQQATGIDLKVAQDQWLENANLTGRLSMDIRGRTGGADSESLKNNLNATGNLAIDQLHLASINLEKSYCELAALVEKPPAREAPWPPGTDLQRFTSQFQLNGQTLELTDYSTGLGNLAVRGNGTIDLDREKFAIKVITNLQGERTSAEGCAVKSKRVRNKDIPLLCKDSFSSAGATSCKPDPDFLKQLLRDEVMDKLIDSEGDDDKTKAVKGLLKGLFGG